MKFVVFGYEFVFRKYKPAKVLVAEAKKKKAREKGYKMCPTMFKRMLTREQAVHLRDTTKAQYLRIYMCEHCNWWHLTHKKQFNTL